MPDVNVPVAPSEAGSNGIEQNNETLERTDEQQLQAATKDSAVSKIESKLRKDYPDWSDDKVKTIAMQAFNRAISKTTGKSTNEGNEDYRESINDSKGGW